jgi:hypothetical protein
LLVSNKFRFTDSLTELSDPTEGTNKIAFELTVECSQTFRANPLDKIPELIIGVENVPRGLHIGRVQTLFRELTKTSSSPTITITASN